MHRVALRATIALVACCVARAGSQTPKPRRTIDAVIASTKPDDWRRLDPENTLYLDLPAGRVVIELAPMFAPNHVANVKALVREGYFNGLNIIRVADNYVVEFQDTTDNPARRRPIRTAKWTLPAELDRAIGPDVPFVPLPDGDVFARQVGWSAGFRSARDPATGRVWMTHCYGTFAAGRDNALDSGGGKDLFVVIGQEPRFLDRNDTVLGRVVQGIALLSGLPRGTGPSGYYKSPSEFVPIKSMKVAADVPPADRVNLEALRANSPAFAEILDIRRHLNESVDWYKNPAKKVELCAIDVPVRVVPAGK